MNQIELNDAFLAYENALLYQVRQIAEHPNDKVRLNHTKPELDAARAKLLVLIGQHTHAIVPTPTGLGANIVRNHPDTLPMVTHYNQPPPPQGRVCLHEYIKMSDDGYQCIFCAHTKPVRT